MVINDKRKWDVFICHASEDKEEFVRPLADALKAQDLRVWYDEFSLTLGDSLRRTIDRGLVESRYGIVVLSPNFFTKEWPQRELDGLCAREISGSKTILPVWHKVRFDDVVRFSPPLADRIAISSSKGLDNVVHEILRVVRPKLIEYQEAKEPERQIDVDIESIRQFLVETAVLAGEKILALPAEEEIEGGISVEEGLHGLVTHADLESENIIKTCLLNKYPMATLVSEESHEKKGTSSFTFFTDPLDGTINYSKRIPYYSISIACQIGRRTVASLVYDLNKHIIYSSLRDGGIFITRLEIQEESSTTMRDHTMKVSESSRLDESVLVTGWPYDEWREAGRSLRYLQHVLKLARDIRRFCAASLDITLVALGIVDGYWETGIGGLWDVLGGALLVREAGGTCAVFQESDTGQVGVIATNGLIHKKLWEIVEPQFVTYELFELFEP